MPPQIPADLLPRARQIILPLIGTEDEREALLTEAFYLYDPLLYGIERNGAAKVFAIRCIKKLLDHGCLPEGEHALARLLETVRYDCGVDKHSEIDALVQITNALCFEPTIKTVVPSEAVVTPTIPTQTIATPRTERTPTVFISYSHQDEPFAQQLIADLNKAGHACWIDTSEIKGGDEWIMTIADGIINSYVFVPIVTLKALHSKWVQDEILWARQKNKLIIPVILENVLGETRFFPLVSYQGVTLFDSDYQTALPKLLSYLPSPTLPDVALDADEEIDEAPAISTKPVTTTVEHRKLELAYLERLRLEELLNTEKYTAMGGTAQVQKQAEMRSVFELIKVGRSEDQIQQETRRFENAVDEIKAIRRCVLLGEPGGGKTTTIWKLAADIVDTALQDRSAPIPLLIRLGKWTDAGQSLPDFIASQLGDLGAHLNELLSEKRAALLLDGLNELPASQYKAKYPQVQKFIEQHPDLLAVVSCRELDYTIELGFDKINITPLDPLRIREFAGRYLGEEKGDDLFWKLAGQIAQDYYKDFVEKVGQEHEGIFWLADQLPSQIKWTYDWDNENKYGYWQNWLKEREKPSGLMVLARNPYMLLMLTSVYADEGELPDNRGQLFAKFVETLLEREEIPLAEQNPLVEGLAKVAYEMQIRRAEAESDGSNALTVLPESDVKAILAERLLYLAGSASILSVGEQIRFTHQLLQEYFAAKYMDIEIEGGRLQATDIWKPENWWERTNWEEAVILLAGLYSDDPTPVIKWLLNAQPEIAAQCITRSGANMPPDATLLLFSKHIPRLIDLHSDPDPQARATIGRALGQLTLSNGEPLDNRKGVSIVMHNTRKLPDIDWVTIPAGEYTYGDNNKDDYTGYGKPADRQKLTLPEFEISRYPVTYDQFQCFLDAEDGYNSPVHDWFEGLSADADDKKMSEQYFKYSNHPREMVNWYQAVAFCRWLSWKLRPESFDMMRVETWAVRLPTEFEWEKVARANTGWQYPYGDKFAKGKTSEIGIRQTSAVGIFPHGDTTHWDKPISDLSGNVFEWCLTDYKNPSEDAAKENISSNCSRVLRGSSGPHDDASAVYRNSNSPHLRFYDRGFRLCRPVG
jgi:formylglycine-generating enzyme required for sulfatase activity